MGEYGEAILLCVQCFQGLEALKDLKVPVARGEPGAMGSGGGNLFLLFSTCAKWVESESLQRRLFFCRETIRRLPRSYVLASSGPTLRPCRGWTGP